MRLCRGKFGNFLGKWQPETTKPLPVLCSYNKGKGSQLVFSLESIGILLLAEKLHVSSTLELRILNKPSEAHKLVLSTEPSSPDMGGCL